MTILDTVMLWLWLHKVALFLFIALTLWAGAMAVYFRGQIERWQHRGRKHNWAIDLSRRTAFRNGKIETAPEVGNLQLK